MRLARCRDDASLVSRALARALTLDDGRAPEWIELLPAGVLAARDGRRWTHHDPEAVLAATRDRAGAIDLVVDYEHQTDHTAENGQPAPAAGWIKQVELRDGALWGRVEWTAAATAAIEAREYRYISPTFAYDQVTFEVRALHRAALTNSPALDMPALATDRGGSPLNETQMKALAEALGLAKDATPDTIIAQAKAAGTAVAEALGPIAEALGLAKDATPDAIVAKAKTTAPDPGLFVPRAEFDRVAVDLKTLQDERTEERATAAVDDAVAGGKIAPAQRDWALGYARSDAEGFGKFVAAAPVILAPTRTGGAPPAADPDAALTAEELATCRTLGISAEDFKKSRAAIAKRREGDQ